jgi:hypothetical protein
MVNLGATGFSSSRKTVLPRIFRAFSEDRRVSQDEIGVFIAISGSFGQKTHQ